MSTRRDPLIVQASVVAIEGRALMIEGPPGSGKSSLALALIEQGAQLIGDDGASLWREETLLMAGPPPRTAGLLEIRGIGLAHFEIGPPSPLALVLSLGNSSERIERLPKSAPRREILGFELPVLDFDPGAIAPAARARWALRMHGLPVASSPHL